MHRASVTYMFLTLTISAMPLLMNVERRRMLMYPPGAKDVLSTKGLAGSVAMMAEAAAKGFEGAPSLPCAGR